MLVFMNKDGIFQKTEWYLVNLFTHGNFDEKLLFKLVKPFFNHFLDKNKQTVQTVLQSLGMCKRQNLGKKCQMKNRSHKDEAALLKYKKKLAVCQPMLKEEIWEDNVITCNSRCIYVKTCSYFPGLANRTHPKILPIEHNRTFGNRTLKQLNIIEHCNNQT